ncbi:MAG: TaqI-like C-terminal specificity domain-containing protein [Bacteroidota bacterium]|nr:TaqI-like C-terminal specificity domain-containing protein [Bacteroidota bacterium]
MTIQEIDAENCSIPLMTDNGMRVVRKVINNAKLRLKDIGRCYEGEINLTFHKKYIRPSKTGNALLIKGAAIQRYRILEKMKQGEVEYLEQKRYIRDNGGPKSKHFREKRIVMQGITGVNEHTRLKMTILDSEAFLGNSANYILLRSKDYSYEFILGVLNSKLINWYFKLFSTNSNVNGYEIDNIPIPECVIQDEITEIVSTILSLTENQDYESDPKKQAKVKELELQMDHKVNRTYGLSDEDFLIVKGQG